MPRPCRDTPQPARSDSARGAYGPGSQDACLRPARTGLPAPLSGPVGPLGVGDGRLSPGCRSAVT